jgi:hypothetical protein
VTPECHAELVLGGVTLSDDAREVLRARVIAAIKSERERIAAAVEGFADGWREDVPKLTAYHIARRIREGT